MTMSEIRGEERLLIDGVLRPAKSGKAFETINPATEEVLGVAADGGGEDMDEAIAAARRAFDESGWATDTALRVRCLRQLHDAYVGAGAAQNHPFRALAQILDDVRAAADA